jgi:plasmid stabilization system protein ParE
MPRAFRVVLSALADSHLREIGEYIAQDSPQAARSLVEQLVRTIDQLQHFPRRCALAPDMSSIDAEIRHAIVKPYRIIFEISGQNVLILAIRHGARAPLNSLTDLEDQ